MGTHHSLARSDESFNQSAGRAVVLLCLVGFLGSVGSWWMVKWKPDTSHHASYGSGWSQHPLAAGFFLMMLFGVVALSTKKRMPIQIVVIVASVNLVVALVTCFTSRLGALKQFGASFGDTGSFSTAPSLGLIACALAALGLFGVAVRSAVWK